VVYYSLLLSEKWEAPMSNTGKMRPPPVGGHVFTKVDRHRALYFGGKGENGMTNVSYIFDLEEKASVCVVGLLWYSLV